MKVLLDTDVNLDFILQRQPFYVDAKEIFKRLANNDFEAYICDITVLNIFLYNQKTVYKQSDSLRNFQTFTNRQSL